MPGKEIYKNNKLWYQQKKMVKNLHEVVATNTENLNEVLK